MQIAVLDSLYADFPNSMQMHFYSDLFFITPSFYSRDFIAIQKRYFWVTLLFKYHQKYVGISLKLVDVVKGLIYYGIFF